MSYFLILTAVFCIAHGESMHHFRHHGLVAEALRERLGVADSTDNNDNEEVSQQMVMMLIPELRKALSNLHEARPTRRLMKRLHPFMMETEKSKGKKEDDQENQESKIQDEAYNRIVTLALSHVLKNLQTVEGGQEAARWIQTLRKEPTTKKPTTGEWNTVTATPVSLDDQIDDDVNKV